MGMPFQPWRAVMVPASFAGNPFFVEQGGRPGGRRLSTHEYAKGETPFTEDLGRKATRWQITGYCIGPNYLAGRDAIIAASNTEGPYTLVHPSMGEMQVHCDSCVPIETKDKGGFCAFEMVFVEAGSEPTGSSAPDTQAQAASAAGASNDTAAATGNAGLAGQGGIGSDAVAGGTAGAPQLSPMAGNWGSDTAAAASTGAGSTYPSSISPSAGQGDLAPSTVG